MSSQENVELNNGNASRQSTSTQEVFIDINSIEESTEFNDILLGKKRYNEDGKIILYFRYIKTSE